MDIREAYDEWIDTLTETAMSFGLLRRAFEAGSRAETNSRLHTETATIQACFDAIPVEVAPGSPHITTAVRALAAKYEAARVERDACLDVLHEHGGTLLERCRKSDENNHRNAHTATELSGQLSEARAEVERLKAALAEALRISEVWRNRHDEHHDDHSFVGSREQAAREEEREAIAADASTLAAKTVGTANAVLTGFAARVRERGKSETVSEACRRTGVQACHVCDDLKCGDNARGKP